MNIYELTYPSGSGTPDQPVTATAVVIASSPAQVAETCREHGLIRKLKGLRKIGEAPTNARPRTVSAEL